MELLAVRGRRRGTTHLAALTVFVLLLGPALSSCRQANAGAAKAVDRIKTTGKVRFGYRVDARPFSFEDESGRPAGYAVELCNSVARLIQTQLAVPGLKVDWVPLKIGEWSDAVEQHRVDLYCSSATETLDRRRQVDYSLPVFPGGVGVVVRADAPAALKEMLAGKANARPAWDAVALDVVRGQTFAVVKGTTADQWASQQRDALKIDSKILPVDGYAAGVKAVADRRADAFFGETAIVRDLVRRRKDASLITINRMFTYEPVALAMQRDDDDFRLLVDRALSERFGAADFWAVYTRWFGMPEVTDVVFYLWNTLPK